MLNLLLNFPEIIFNTSHELPSDSQYPSNRPQQRTQQHHKRSINHSPHHKCILADLRLHRNGEDIIIVNTEYRLLFNYNSIPLGRRLCICNMESRNIALPRSGICKEDLLAHYSRYHQNVEQAWNKSIKHLICWRLDVKLD